MECEFVKLIVGIIIISVALGIALPGILFVVFRLFAYSDSKEIDAEDSW